MESGEDGVFALGLIDFGGGVGEEIIGNEACGGGEGFEEFVFFFEGGIWATEVEFESGFLARLREIRFGKVICANEGAVAEE